MQSLEKEKVHKGGNNAVKGLKKTPKKISVGKTRPVTWKQGSHWGSLKAKQEQKGQSSLGKAACAQTLGTGSTAKAPSGFSGFLEKILSLETS